ncbi:DoxX family protein [Shewanella yunxiaonensis]|uniref:DoxX family protein n=1 Tax=Shewanella yunxiaonensis TaxID=2829809 RepID=A0ABX7YPR7_9GAMM|nr:MULTISPECIES: DoxX family protein [Shewanella]MDF0534828.1 DoxX family protein [Shewanella sp. A32]QUN04755.1 DoxX family protein [Shewanella yunxiaonensis]
MKKLIATLVSNNAGYAPLIMRVPVGLTLMAHGSQKLFGMFGGYGLEGTGQWMASIGLTPGYLMALLAGSGEFFGGLFLLLGLLLRPAAAVVAFTMLVALFTVHIHNGLFMANNGYEYALTLAAIALSLVVSGAGKVSLDNIIARKL